MCAYNIHIKIYQKVSDLPNLKIQHYTMVQLIISNCCSCLLFMHSLQGHPRHFWNYATRLQKLHRHRPDFGGRLVLLFLLWLPWKTFVGCSNVEGASLLPVPKKTALPLGTLKLSIFIGLEGSRFMKRWGRMALPLPL